MYKIATLNKISKVGLNRLTADYKIIDEVEKADGILLRSQNIQDMKFPSNLIAIARAGAGVNNIPVERCTEEGIVVFNTPGANANAVKELVLAGILLAARNIPDGVKWISGITEDVSKAVEKGKSRFAGSEIKGKTLGIIGLGAIGVMVANAASELGMNVVGYDPFITLRAAHALYSTIPVLQDLGELLPECDFISIHVPSNDQTNGMIDSRRFDQMKTGAIFLNFARDKLVNDKAMLKALETGKIKRYVTDFPNDTVIGHEGVIAIPHLGASTSEAEDNCAVMASSQMMSYIEKGNIVNSVNYPTCSLGPIPAGTTRVCILNKNIPAVLGKITGLLADMNINIKDLTNKSKGGYAVTLMDIEGDIDEDKLKEKLTIDEIVRVRVMKPLTLV